MTSGTRDIELDIENSAGADHWKVDAIEQDVADKLKGLIDLWDVDFENITSSPVLVKVAPGFGARISDEGIVFSDPDHYSVGMKNIFDGEDQEIARELVERKYPVPFHEVAEELGQLIGRRASNDWVYEEDPSFRDGLRDELHGMMALDHYYPNFLQVYRDQIERNLHAIEVINPEEQAEHLARLDDLADLGQDPYGDFGLDSEKVQYTRSSEDLPETFGEKVVELLEKEDGYDLSNLSYEDLNEWRKKKMESDGAVEQKELYGKDSQLSQPQVSLTTDDWEKEGLIEKYDDGSVELSDGKGEEVYQLIRGIEKSYMQG